MLLNRKTAWCTAFGLSLGLAMSGSPLNGSAYAKGASGPDDSANPVTPKFNEKTVLEVRQSLSMDSMIHDAEQFELQRKTVARADDCLPLFVRQITQLRILYMHCSAEALKEDSKARKVTETFTVSEALAPRFNFWRRVYSLWAKDQYVLHSSEYPEVILEIIDASKVYKTDFLGREAQAERFVSNIASMRRANYRNQLMQLHRDRKKDPKSLSPALQRIATLFDHIEDPMKYSKASRSLRMQRGQRDFIANGLTVGPKYLQAIEAVFQEQGVPKELSRLAYIESSFNLLALSKVGASGVYQIMPETGRQYLRMIPGIDERNEPIKAATAAAKLLKLNYQILGSWPLAVTAYNHGVGGLQKAVRKSGSTDLGYMVHHYSSPQFQFASKNFFCGFAAILATLEESEKLFPDVAIATPVKFQMIKLTKPQTVAAAAKTNATTIDELLSLNRDIQRSYAKSGGLLPRGYRLKVPPTAAAEIAAVSTSQIGEAPGAIKP